MKECRKGTRYWYITTGFEDSGLAIACCFATGSTADNERAGRGNMFKTERKCRDALNGIRKILKHHRRVKEGETYWYLKSGISDSFLEVREEMEMNLDADRGRNETNNYARSFEEMQEARERIAEIFRKNR